MISKGEIEKSDKETPAMWNMTFAEDMNVGNMASAKLGDAFKNIEFDPDFSYFARTKKAATNLSWNGLSLTIGEKDILHGVSGHVKGGEVIALMGPRLVFT